MKQQTLSRQRTAVFPHAKAHSAVCIGDSYSCIACLTYTRDHLQPGRVGTIGEAGVCGQWRASHLVGRKVNLVTAPFCCTMPGSDQLPATG